MEVRGVKAQWHSTSPFHSQPLIHHDKCAQMIWPSSTNGERRARTSFAQDPLQLIHPALLWANWSGALPACVLLIYPTQFNGSCSQRSYFFPYVCTCLCVFCVDFAERGVWGCKICPRDPKHKARSQTCVHNEQLAAPISVLSYVTLLLFLLFLGPRLRWFFFPPPGALLTNMKVHISTWQSVLNFVYFAECKMY